MTSSRPVTIRLSLMKRACSSRPYQPPPHSYAVGGTAEPGCGKILSGEPRRRASNQNSRLRAPSTLENSWLRSEEHTSELQSLRHLVCRLLLEKKKND